MFSTFVRICLVCFIVFSINGVKSKIVYNTRQEIVTRATIFQPEVINKICLLKPDVGPCRAEIPMFYFEPRYQNCSMFLWGGCQGNGNRYDTESECRQTCLSKSGEKRKPKWCSLSFDYGFCFGSIERWYYDPLWKVCKQRIYSGCGGNKNNFYNKEQCDAICNFGTGVIKGKAKYKSSLKKVLIVNPLNLTRKRERYQETSSNKANSISTIKIETKTNQYWNSTSYSFTI